MTKKFKKSKVQSFYKKKDKKQKKINSKIFFPIKGIKLTDIQLKIIKFIFNNRTKLNYYFEDGKLIQLNKKIIEKVKGSCLCRVSDEFGTAVCISEKGYILTCSHAAPPFEDDNNKESLYIFQNGEIVKALTLEKDDQLDLALLKIIEIYENGKFTKIENFPQKKFNYSKIKISSLNEKIGENVFCIGNPCFTMYDDDGKLENNKYKPFWISFGKIKGYIKDGIYCKNDLGPLIHSCWTYWGHSGAPIFNTNGKIVGMHNSWNEKNANRHGNSLLGIIKFISKFNYLKLL